MMTPAIGHIVRAIPAESCTGTARIAALMPTLAAASGRSGENAKKAALPEPVTVLAVTLLLTIGLVYADIFVFSGEIFERGLAIWRLDIFYQERFAYTLAFAGGIVHPILFIIAGVGLLCLPPPKDGFTMR